mmetsp:Transcript_69654/g.116050  ORF Transcript_69654/g.116050 Transcript_69654/m.116050 type:complete len:206 (+) Transcript_69654:681-1298(+)
MASRVPPSFPLPDASCSVTFGEPSVTRFPASSNTRTSNGCGSPSTTALGTSEKSNCAGGPAFTSSVSHPSSVTLIAEPTSPGAVSSSLPPTSDTPFGSCRSLNVATPSNGDTVVRPESGTSVPSAATNLALTFWSAPGASPPSLSLYATLTVKGLPASMPDAGGVASSFIAALAAGPVGLSSAIVSRARAIVSSACADSTLAGWP